MAPSTSGLSFHSTQAGTSVDTSQGACFFLEVLPVELRFEIYRYLVGRYTKRELNMKSREYNCRRKYILSGPDHTYHLDTSILGINKQIRYEATGLFKRECSFICLISDRFEDDRYRWRYSRRCDLGVAIIAEGDRARAFPNIGITIDYDAGNGFTNSAAGYQRKRKVLVFSMDDLPAASIQLQRNIDYDRQASRFVNMRITISPHVRKELLASKGQCLLPGSKLNRCLEHLRRLRGIGSVAIQGPGHPIVQATANDMCSRPLDAKEIMWLVGAQFTLGDKMSSRGDLRRAIAEYKAALFTIRRSASDETGFDQILIGGRFDGCVAGWARNDAKVQLHARIAEAYRRLGEFRLARVYVERIYGPLHTYDSRFHDQKFPLRLPTSTGVAPYAELLLVAAHISIGHGNYPDACSELYEASELDPSNEDVARLLEQCETRHWGRRNRRSATQNHQRECAYKRFNAALQVIENRKAKGDEAYQSNNLELAQKKYEAAYDKIEQTESMPGGRVSKELMLQILSRLTTVCLELGNYDQVHGWADTIIAPDSWHWDSNPYKSYAAPSEREAFYTAHYSKAFAFEKLGKLNAAIRNYEKALECDRGCFATYWQLEFLRQTKELENLKKKVEGSKLHQHRVIVKKQNEKKERKRVAK